MLLIHLCLFIPLADRRTKDVGRSFEEEPLQEARQGVLGRSYSKVEVKVSQYNINGRGLLELGSAASRFRL
jgi:hypothetical protein